MSKYIIKNCPAYSGTQGVYWTCYEDNNKLLCQDCNDCVMKQIVDLCKKVQELEYQKGRLKYRSPSKAKFGREILKLLDIEEVK